MVSCGEVWLEEKKMEAVMVGQVAQQVVPSGPNPTMGADFFLPYRALLLTFSCPPPPGKFFLPSSSFSSWQVFLAAQSFLPPLPRDGIATGHCSNIQIPIRKEALMTMLMIVMMMMLMIPMMKIFKLGGMRQLFNLI